MLETLVHDPLVEWAPKNAKSGAEEQENAMARDAMATIEGKSGANGRKEMYWLRNMLCALNTTSKPHKFSALRLLKMSD